MSRQVSTPVRRFLNGFGVSVGVGAVFALAGGLLQAQSAPEPPAGNRPFTPQQLSECLSFGEAHTARQAQTGLVRFVGTEPGSPIRQPRPQQATSPESAARAYLSVCSSLFGLSGAAGELAVMQNVAVDGGRSMVRLQQNYGGVRIIGAELVVNLDDTRNILAVSGETLPDASLNLTPTIDAAAAVRRAVELVASSYKVDPQSVAATPPALWIYAPSLIGPETGPAALVWRMDITVEAPVPVRELVLIDAQAGAVALHFNQIETAKNRETYNTFNTQTLPGTLVCNESSPPCAGGDADAMLAHLYAGDTYDYYLATLGRDSLNNAGLTLKSTTHYGPAGYQNAFWNGTQMAYGDGFSKADDVVGHELTHGVTQFTSDLFYYYQSGAINESISDVFGELIDQANGRGNDAAAVRWLIGEDLPGGAGRNMQNPPAFGDPDRITSPLYYVGTADNGGVHFNSGVNNKTAYLMVDGGTFNGRTVVGLGATKVARIYYEAQTHILTSGADYADLYEALFQACNNLVGTGGIVLGDCAQVRTATAAVEMNLQPVAGFNPDAPVCTAGQVPSNVFFDDLEAGPANYLTSTSVGAVRWFYDSPYGAFAHSGKHILYGDDFPEAVADSSVQMANGVVLPANAFLHFFHAFGFQTANRDGGVVEYSTNGGTTWTDAGPLFDNNGYRGAIAAGTGNPLAGRSAFVNTSHGYISSRVNLASLAGQTIRFRWRLGIDTSGYDYGWALDDIRVYTCVNQVSLTGNLAFGGRGIGTRSTRPVTIRNAGTTPLVVTGISYPDGFSGDWAGGAIAPGASRTLTVTFAPTTAGNYGGTITIASNATSGTTSIAASGLGLALVRPGTYDFDGDGKADIGIFRHSNALWALIKSSNNQGLSVGWGDPSTDIPVPADYDGDGKVDIAVYRQTTGQWFIIRSTTNTLLQVAWGAPNLDDIPVPADYDGDGKADIAVYRQSTGEWFIIRSTNSTLLQVSWGTPALGDLAIPADYDGDGKADIAVYRLSTAQWFIIRSSSNTLLQVAWGAPDLLDVPVVGDYDGDGKADIGVYRQTTGDWFILRSSNNTLLSLSWGSPSSGDLPVPADYDGDHKTDIGVFRAATGEWFIVKSATNTLLTVGWGTPVLGDRPLSYP